MNNQMKRKNRYKIWPFLTKLGIIILLILGFTAYNLMKTSDAQTTSALASQVQTVTRYNFIRELAPAALQAQKEDKILPSLTLAQACLESDFGQSLLASKYHNLFGVKAYGNVPTVKLDTQEFENGKWITISGQFRVYATDEASVLGHSKLFVNGTTWNPNQYAAVLNAKDYKAAAKAVQTSGYATDPAYSAKLIQIIESYQLQKHDQAVN